MIGLHWWKTHAGVEKLVPARLAPSGPTARFQNTYAATEAATTEAATTEAKTPRQAIAVRSSAGSAIPPQARYPQAGGGHRGLANRPGEGTINPSLTLCCDSRSFEPVPGPCRDRDGPATGT